MLEKPDRWNDLHEKYRVQFYHLSEQVTALEVATKNKVANEQSTTQNEANPLFAGAQNLRTLDAISYLALAKEFLQLLAERRGQPPAAIVLYTDGVTTEGPALRQAGETAWRMGVPLLSCRAWE